MFDATVMQMTYRAGKCALSAQPVGWLYHEVMQRGVKLGTVSKAIEHEVVRKGGQMALASCVDGKI